MTAPGTTAEFRLAEAAARLTDPAARGRLAYGSFVSLRYRYLYFATPKAACTKTKAVLWVLEGLGRREPWPTAVHRRERYDGRLSLADCSPEAVRCVLSSPDWFRFCFVRNPYSRLLSGYLSKVASGAEEFTPFRAQIARDAGLGSAAAEDIPFAAFVRYVCGQDDGERNEHWRTQSRHLFLDSISYDFIGRIENYAADAAYVLGRLGAPHQLTEGLRQKINATAERNRRRYYTDELAELVSREYRADFENFGYGLDAYNLE